MSKFWENVIEIAAGILLMICVVATIEALL